MIENFYEKLKEQYKNVVYYNYEYICQSNLKDDCIKYKEENLLYKWNEFNENKYWSGYEILSEEGILSEYLDMYEKEIQDSDRDIKELLKEWVKYKIITNEKYDTIINKLKNELSNKAICKHEDYILVACKEDNKYR